MGDTIGEKARGARIGEWGERKMGEDDLTSIRAPQI
jgi:hypothetical protein